MMRVPEEPGVRLILSDNTGQVRPKNGAQLAREPSDQLRMGAVMRDHDGPAGEGPGQPVLEPGQMVLMDPDRLVRADLPVYGPGVPDVAVVVHPLTSDDLRVLGVPGQVEVSPERAAQEPHPGDRDLGLLSEVRPLLIGDPGQPVVPVKLEIVITVVPGNDVNPAGVDMPCQVPDRVFSPDPGLVGQVPGDQQGPQPNPVPGREVRERVPPGLGLPIEMDVRDDQGFHAALHGLSRSPKFEVKGQQGHDGARTDRALAVYRERDPPGSPAA